MHNGIVDKCSGVVTGWWGGNGTTAANPVRTDPEMGIHAMRNTPNWRVLVPIEIP